MLTRSLVLLVCQFRHFRISHFTDNLFATTEIIQKDLNNVNLFFVLCGRWDLNPHERNAHKILSLARLPVPTLPHILFRRIVSSRQVIEYQRYDIKSTLFYKFFYFFVFLVQFRNSTDRNIDFLYLIPRLIIRDSRFRNPEHILEFAHRCTGLFPVNAICI